jgi:hypothetical protein
MLSMQSVNRFSPAVFLAACFAAMIGTSAPAAAQTAGPGSGPLVLTPIPSNLIISPDVKVTRVNHQTATLVGGFAGRLMDRQFLIGAGGYWLADPRQDVRMGYGGLELGWRVYGGERLNIGASGLLGLGTATLFLDRSIVPIGASRHGGRDFDRAGFLPVRFGVREDFALAEPQVNVQLGLTRVIRLNVGGGYRFMSVERGADDLLRGASASVGIQFSIGD